MQVGDTRGRCQTYHEVHGKSPRWGQDEEADKPWAKHVMCIAEEEHGGDTKISKLLAHRDHNDKLLQMHGRIELQGEAHLRVDSDLAGSHMVSKD